MPSACRYISKVLKSIDLFPTANLLRYNEECQYTTATGGCLSSTVIVICVILFASMGVKTLDRKIITASSTTIYEIDPKPLEVTVSPEGGFMFGIGIFGMDVTSATKAFSISLWQQSFTPVYNLINRTEIPLIPCTEAHFNFNEQIRSGFHVLNLSQSLCPPLGHKLEVNGKISSSLYQQFRVLVQRCDYPSEAGCLNDTEYQHLQSLFQHFTLTIPIVKTSLNPSNEEYRTYFLDSANYFSFNTALRVKGTIDLQQDIVQTDISIMPYTDIQTEEVISIPQLIRTSYFIIDYSRKYSYAEVAFSKSPSSQTYTRSFNKIDAYFSYVGGLVGTIIGLIFIVSKYNETAFEISLSRKLFKSDQGTEVPSDKFNFGYYLLMSIKKMMKLFGCDPQWLRAQLFIDCCEEVTHQLDVTYLLRKLMAAETALSKLLEQHQWEAICMRQKPTLTKIKDIRRMHFAPELYEMGAREGKVPTEFFGDRPVSPAKNHKSTDLLVVDLHTQGKQKQGTVEELSGLELSHRSQEVQRIEASINKILMESRDGRILSRRIMQDLPDQLVQNRLRDYQSAAKEVQVQIIDPEPVVVAATSTHYQEARKRRLENVEEPEGFDFNLEKI